MKIQSLAIIFIIIILPISFALSLYTKAQIQTLALQREYDVKLQSSTYDALQTFQINTRNNTESELADSKLKDIEASVNIFFNSLASNFGLKGNSEKSLREYVPALVYTMYDGYYIYSPYSNVATTTADGVIINKNEEKNIEYGLKPYIYYSCRYKTGSSDFIITYSLDNYIAIKGIVRGKYVNDAGYVISGIEPQPDGTYKYNGIVIEIETQLEEYLGNVKYPYVKISGTKYYLDKSNRRIFYILNGVVHNQVTYAMNPELYNKYVNLITDNSSALRYYKEAYEFTKRLFSDYNLSTLEITDAVDSNGNQLFTVTNEQRSQNRHRIFNTDVSFEMSASAFNQHRKQVIRYTIESNLAMAIANFNRYSSNSTFDYQMPQLKEYDWDSLASNVSIVSFLQGLSIGGKIYNGYSVVANTETEELIREQDIYLIGADNQYHRAEDTYLLTYGTLGQYKDKESYSRGTLDLDFDITWVNDSNSNTVYYYPREQLACYDCIINQSGINSSVEYTNIYDYFSELNINTQTTLLKKVYYTALGRERWGQRLNTVKLETLDDMVIDNNYDTGEITIDFDPDYPNYTKDSVAIKVNFSDSINLDKVVIRVQPGLQLSTIEYAALMDFNNNNFTEITSNPMSYSLSENGIVYVVAFSKTGRKIIKYDFVNWIDKDPPRYTGSLTGTVQNINQVRLNLTLPDPSDVARVDVKYKVNGSSTSYATKSITDRASITSSFQTVVTDLTYATTYDMYLILYDYVGNTTETNHVYPTTLVATKEFPYSPTTQTYTVQATGWYILKAWASDGGDYSGHTGGNGGYVSAKVYLIKGQVVTVNTGTRGSNYGGSGSGGASGGGRTDISVNGTLILVAGGGRRRKCIL